jgi:glycosyltransferase involved in cell wall biosynthesis
MIDERTAEKSRAESLGSAADAMIADARWPVMVLAHNEERHITACLDSILQSDVDARFDVYVMANGCTDRTEDVVRDYAGTHRQVHLVSIALGDKCNAWNVFIHDVVPSRCAGRQVYFFMDGDARAIPGSFSAMARTLRATPHAHAASAPPASGRNADRDRRDILERHGLVANLYALRGTFVERLGAAGVRIPLKLEGDDGLIGALVKWDLDPQRNGYDDARIVPCPDAGFTFESMSLVRIADWRVYWKRAVRYGRRRYEFQLLGPPMKAHGLAGLPSDIRKLYPAANSLRLQWDGVYTLSNWLALRAMRRIGSRFAGQALPNGPVA